ncbi:chaperone protein dnaJ 11, chloroplastic-like [Magnolia sinica]|uniref:chaperone protein dnaJ 11, chloroplastic-like n=1 Tax=Magnolia sinica TaxID=86752 RepID=UPI002657FFF9|nr:chaperone protein dnaJ 11, chloroplastic-like [Magnolia sinica]
MSASLSLSSTLRFHRSNRRNPSARQMTILAFAPSVSLPKPSNLYDVLRVKQTASPIEIKTAYRALAKRFHPDTGSDGRDFIQIHEAYATLSDPTARSLYDRSMERGLRFDGRDRSGPAFRTRRWETDQCW